MKSPKTRLHWTMATSLAALASVGAAPLNDAVPTADDAACTPVTTKALADLGRTLGRALAPAAADARKNGTSGSYAVAARNTRDLIQRAKNRVEEAEEWLEKAPDPRVTSYAEGGQIKEYLRPTFEWLSQAGHWATISATYHRSTDAQQAFDRTTQALVATTQRYREAGQCFMSGFPT